MESSTQTLVLPLTSRRARQLFKYDNGNEKLTFMYDSGARIPVWCSGEEMLLKAYPNAEKQQLTCIVSGFGKEPETGAVYKIPQFVLSDDSVVFIINNLYIATIEKPTVGCDLILSETMFMKTDMNIYRINKRELHIIYEEKEFQCTPIRRKDNLDEVTVWSQM